MPLRLPRFRFTRRAGKVLLGILIFVLVVCGLAAWQVPRVLHDVLTQDVSRMLGRDVAVGKISFNPFTLTVRAHDLSVAQPGADAPLLALSELDVSAAWSSLFWFAPVIDRLTLREPRIAVVREDVARFNFSDVQQRVAELSAPRPGEPPPKDEGLPRFSLNNMRIEGGAITLDDKVTGRKQVVDELALGVPFISTFGYATDIDVQPRLHLRINGSPFDLDGVARPFDVVPSSSLRVAFTGLQLEKWADAWPLPLPFRLQRALLDSNLRIVFEQPKDAPPKIRIAGDLGLRRFDLRDLSGQPLAAWSALTVSRLELEPIARTVHVGEIALWAPEVYARRDAQQRLNWQEVADKLKALGGAASPPRPPAQAAHEQAAQATQSAPPADAPAGAQPPAAQPGGAAPASSVPSGEPASPPDAASAEPGAWKVALDAFNLHEGLVAITDAASKLDYTLSGLGATAEAVALPQAADEPVNLWVTMDNAADGGWLRAKGPLVLQPLALDLNLRMGNVALAPLAPAVRSVSPLLVQDGRLGLAAQVRVRQEAGKVAVSATGAQLDLASFKARDESLQPALDLSLAQLHVAADRLALDSQPTPFTASATGIQGEGRLALKGTLTPQPLAVQTSVDLAGLDVAAFAPYAASSLNATVRSVTLGAKGEAAFAAGGGSPMKASWKGGVDVTDVDLQDRVNKDDFLNWKRLGFAGMDVSMAGDKLAVALGDVALEDFYGRVLLNAEGRLNVMDLVAEPGQAGGSITQDTQTRGRRAGAPERGSGALPDISVNSVKLTRGRMTFTDRFVKPNYVAELSSVEGSISAVSSMRPQPAKVQVTGRVYTTAPLSISGVVQPFAKFLALDLKASAKGVDLPRFTTYSAKYVGYPIKRGKLSVDLEYKIKNRDLTASNHVVLNQLTFGDKTNSPDATKLPVLLAVALLKDSRGNIDINLPISGSLDDPQFSVGGIILRVLGNLLVKAVTSPFSLLASAFGSDEELSYVEFAPGSAALTPESLERIETLGKALADRPGLKMDISGRADPAADDAGLRQAWVEAQIRAAKARDVAPRGKKPDPSKVEVSPAEREKYLEEVYDDTDIEDKPRNFIGMAKSIPADQMEALLRKAAQVGDEQLRQLADARAQAVYEKLQRHEGLAERIFIVAPQLNADGIKDGGQPSRVDFSLK